jgi:hypothetical protein
MGQWRGHKYDVAASETKQIDDVLVLVVQGIVGVQHTFWSRCGSGSLDHHRNIVRIAIYQAVDCAKNHSSVLSHLLKSFEYQKDEQKLAIVKQASPVAWYNINLKGTYRFKSTGKVPNLEQMMRHI